MDCAIVNASFPASADRLCRERSQRPDFHKLYADDAMTRLLFAFALAAIGVVFAGSANAADPSPKPAASALTKYIVVRGDTLWDISGRFLNEPRRWPEIWRMNRDVIENPHLIHPGETILLERDVRRGAATYEQVSTLRGHKSRVLHAVFSPDGQTLASSGDETVILWDVRDPGQVRLAQILRGHDDMHVSCHVAFSPDGRTLASSDWRGSVILWDMRDGPDQARLIRIFRHTKLQSNHRDTPKSSRSGDTSDLRINGLSSATWYQSHESAVSHIVFSPDGQMLASASYDKTVILWDVRDPSQALPVRILRGHEGVVWHIAFSPDGRTLASASDNGIGSKDGIVMLWDVRDPSQARLAQMLRGHDRTVDHVAFSPDGQILASADQAGKLILWDMRRYPGQVVPVQTLPHYGISDIAFSPDGRTLASAGGDEVVLWDMRDSGQVRFVQLQGNKGISITSIAFSPDGETLAGGSTDGTVSLWNVRDPGLEPLRKKLKESDKPWDMRDLDLESLRKKLKELDKQRNMRDPGLEPVQTLLGLSRGVPGREKAIPYVTFSPDGQTLASASDDAVDDATVILWRKRDLDNEISGVSRRN
jgi:WD40 repeat protein